MSKLCLLAGSAISLANLPGVAHWDPIAVTPEPIPYFEVSETHKENWANILEQCPPVDTREKIDESCLVIMSDYFLEQPIWSYRKMYHYHIMEGWRPIFVMELNRRMPHTAADFVNTDVPLWQDVFDGQVEQRLAQVLDVVTDPDCLELANVRKVGIDESNAARELYKYATYLDACYSAVKRLDYMQEVFSGGRFTDLSRYEISLRLLDTEVTDVELRASAKRRMAKGYLHSYWVKQQCDSHGYVSIPGITLGSITTSTDKIFWPEILDHKVNERLLNHTHDVALKIAAKGGDDWAIRSFDIGRSSSAEFNDDLMKKYPLLWHRTLGDDGFGFGFTKEDEARYRAKAYLMLLEQVGEEIAQREYDPATLKEEIEYVQNGGVLKPIPSLPEIITEDENKRQSALKRLRQQEEDEMFREAEGELH